MNNHVNYIDGIKGVSTLIVFICHFVGLFLSFSYIGNIPGLNIILDGASAVHIFIMLSGFSVCSSLAYGGGGGKEANAELNISKLMLKRYFRLALPIVIPTILTYLFWILGLCYNHQMGNLYNNQFACDMLPAYISIPNLISSVFFGPIRSSIITPLWMMHYIFFGTFIIIPIFICANTLTKKIRYTFLLCISVIILRYNIYYFSVVVGIFFYFYIKDGYNNNQKSKILSILSLIILFTTIYYKINNINVIRAFFIVFCIINCKILQNVFSITFLQYINKIGYQIYLIHIPIIGVWSCFLFIKLGITSFAIILNFFSTIALVLLTAVILTKYDKCITNKLNAMLNKTLKTTQTTNE